MSWKDNSWLILDVETTGLEAAKERVIEVGYCRVEKRIILETQSFLINPDRQELPEIITKITGLTIADLLPHPKFSTRALQIADLMRQAYVVAAYNAPFDKGFFHYEFERAGHVLPEKPWLDPCVWVKQVDKFQKGKKLIEAASRRNIQVTGAHRAGADAEMAARVMLTIIDSLPDELSAVLELQSMWARQQEADRKNFFASKAVIR